MLDLSYNQLADIPFSFLARLTEMLYLDLGHNRLKELPPQFRRYDATIRPNHGPLPFFPAILCAPSLTFVFVSGRLANLRTLILNHNPLKFEKLSVRFALHSLYCVPLVRYIAHPVFRPATSVHLQKLGSLDNLTRLELRGTHRGIARLVCCAYAVAQNALLLAEIRDSPSPPLLRSPLSCWTWSGLKSLTSLRTR